MILLTKEEIIRIHTRLIDRTGGSHGLRDEGLLESAIYSAESSFEDYELYSTAEEKAARLCYSLTNDHAFVDGNKRIGVMVMLLTLRLNGVSLSYTQQELIELGLSVAKNESQYDDILSWINQHKD